MTSVLSADDFDALVAAAMDALPSWSDLERYQQGTLDPGGRIVLEAQLCHNAAARQRYKRVLEHERLMGRDATESVVSALAEWNAHLSIEAQDRSSEFAAFRRAIEAPAGQLVAAAAGPQKDTATDLCFYLKLPDGRELTLQIYRDDERRIVLSLETSDPALLDRDVEVHVNGFGKRMHLRPRASNATRADNTADTDGALLTDAEAAVLLKALKQPDGRISLSLHE